MLLRFLSGLYLGNETTNKLNEGQYSADHCADVFKNRIGSACWCVFGMEHTALHMEMLITDLYVIGKVQAKADGVQDDSLVSRHKLTPPGADFGGRKQ